MAKKKIMLFIVEGPTDETALSTVLKRIFTSATVNFQVTHGDVLTRGFTSSNQIVAAVCDEVKRFAGEIYKASDFCKVIHLTDMDGVFIPDNAVIEDAEQGKSYPFYTDTQILTPTPWKIIERNAQKRDNILKLSGRSSVWKTIPYSFYYFSCNLDHTLYGVNNLSEAEKIRRANDFDLQYADQPEAFIRFMQDEPFVVHGSYREIWEFIRQGTHSLERHSNFWLELPSIQELHPPQKHQLTRGPYT